MPATEYALQVFAFIIYIVVRETDINKIVTKIVKV